ncbi:hypothetical protein JTE90_028487 [Oedothorax gibbosus]|uniref:Uncharacterized protein n=1 Tax=Oedothorax gibbosus TaxID=931172 RepID=A0AAV6VW17_9ARAC|nr:hypothetical protein JTE90_028487 [Oedothorax gibbosus]
MQVTATQDTPAESAFRSRHHLGKPTKRTKNALPKSPRKKKEVNKMLAIQEGLMLKESSNQFKTKSTAIPEETEQSVQTFYKRDDVSRMLPGKRDCDVYLAIRRKFKHES